MRSRPVTLDEGNPMKLGILGTGHVAKTLGTAWSKTHEVTLGSRSPDTADDGLPVRSHLDVVKDSDIVVNAIPGSVAVDAISAIAPGTFGGKTLVDVANAITASFGLLYPDGSLAERLQAARPDARVVKSMNTAAITTIVNPGVIPASSVFLSGAEPAAKSQARGLLHDLGWTDGDIVDLGGIETARGPEHYIVLFAELAGLLKTEAFNIRVVR
jgi:8-hydroxy-5-deazaflavin:NADPH oxidoreductase